MTNLAGSPHILPAVLQVGMLPADASARLAECFSVYTADGADGAMGDFGLEKVAGIATNGKSTVGADLLDPFPDCASSRASELAQRYRCRRGVGARDDRHHRRRAGQRRRRCGDRLDDLQRARLWRRRQLR